ncbi:MAG: Cof-type HAD-IIB family hydrolase [Firmicutes bacterium]|nr:Cof-type HAD-IIB family hydrolase [Bacillota bacterium]
MDFKRFKLAVFDLDGTLVEYGSDRITPATREAVNTLRENNTLVTIATGRSWEKTRALVEELEIRIPVIVQSGAIIIDPLTETIIKSQPLRTNLERKLPGILGASRADHFRLSEDGIYYTTKVSTSGGKWLFGGGEGCRLAPEHLNQNSVIKHLFTGAEAELRPLAKLVGELRPTPNIILWPPDQLTDDWFLEVFDPLASKGQALSWLADYLGLSLNEVIAFGDGHNDLDMLETAGFGVAMNGSPQELIQQADLVIPGAVEEGIARLFRGEPVGVKIKVS